MVLMALAGGCSSSASSRDAATDGLVYDLALDLPVGCPPDAGNALGVGAHCTRGGNQCGAVGSNLVCACDTIDGVTLVGVVGADMALGLPDFRAAERTFQLLTQVAGRAGRGQSPGKVVLQTYFQEHYAVQFAARHDFAGFYDKELQFRAWMHYPPYSAIANVLIRSEKLDEALTWSGELGRWFEKTRHEGIRVLGPAAAPITRLKRDYRYHFILKSPSREKMNALLRAMLAEAAARKIPRTQVIVDVDAVWLM